MGNSAGEAKSLRVTVAYVHVALGAKSLDYASRFAATYFSNPPGAQHETIICCQGGPPSVESGEVLNLLSPKFYPRHNDLGWDLSAYCEVARQLCDDTDILLALGESVHFFKPGWLQRIVDCWNEVQPGMLGFFSNNNLSPHLILSAFAIDPKLLKSIPAPRTKAERYELEYGHQSIWRRVRALGRPVRFVTWDGTWHPEQWRTPGNILWKGEQTNLLMWSNHTERYRNANQATKRTWEANANSPFKNV